LKAAKLPVVAAKNKFGFKSGDLLIGRSKKYGYLIRQWYMTGTYLFGKIPEYPLNLRTHINNV
jgi:hypothetical protein